MSAHEGAPRTAAEWTYGGFWTRTVGYCVDAVITATPGAALAAVIGVSIAGTLRCTTVQQPDGVATLQCANARSLALFVIPYLLLLLLPGVYFTVAWSRSGASLGQRLLDLRVIDAHTGRTITPARACVRFLGMILSAWTLGIGLIWAAADPRKQGWHDKMAGTVVVRRTVAPPAGPAT